ncbi:MAG: LysR family transcriptional regulator [Pyramidobacter sp.]|jgi:DNA-binding transcriptional LysR family regulator
MKNELKYVETVYQKGSFSKAAEVLHLTQPALSLAIARVESEIGMALFDRKSHPLGLTEAGQIYIKTIRQIATLEDELKCQLHDLSDVKIGTVRIGATSYITSCVLPPVLKKFKAQYPAVELQITEAGAYELKELLHARKIDLTFSSHPDERYAFDRRFAFCDHLLLSVPAHEAVNSSAKKFALRGREVVSGIHLKSNCPIVDLKLFRTTPFILLEKKYNLRRRSDEFFAASGFSPVICLEVAQIITAAALSRAGLGAVFLPDRAVETDDDACFYKIASSRAIRRMDIVTNSKGYLSKATQCFIDIFKNCYRSNVES